MFSSIFLGSTIRFCGGLNNLNSPAVRISYPKLERPNEILLFLICSLTNGAIMLFSFAIRIIHLSGLIDILTAGVSTSCADYTTLFMAQGTTAIRTNTNNIFYFKLGGKIINLLLWGFLYLLLRLLSFSFFA